MVYPVILEGGSRVAFSRPGSMMKIPTSTVEIPTNLFTVGASAEIFKIDPFNQGGGMFLNAYLSQRFNLGFSVISFADTSTYIEKDSTLFKPVNETGLHFQYTVYQKKSVSIGIGIQDILIRKGEDINQNKWSIYAVFSSERDFDEFTLGSYLGFGSGSIGFDSGIESDTITNENQSSGGVFLGFLLKTPYMKEFGGMDFMAEFDGSGLNMGVKIPITQDYKIMLGVTHFENLGDYGTQSDDTEPLPLSLEAPSITVGFSMSIPGTFKGSKPTFKKPGFTEDDAEIKTEHSQEFDEMLSTLRDSLKYDRFQIENLTEHNSQLEQQISKLVDSTRVLHLENQVFESNLNKTMRHLSRSLRHYYSGDYMMALQEVELALHLNPELAVAYARRGSIYFKLGDEQKAIINWNIALKLDPEYEEVRTILQALHENRLKSATNLNDDQNGL